MQGGRIIMYVGNYYARGPQEGAVHHPELRHKE